MVVHFPDIQQFTQIFISDEETNLINHVPLSVMFCAS
jgi:hypothetical protein